LVAAGATGRKVFFFEKKKQKTFVNLASVSPDGFGQGNAVSAP
jgi:hypothetical protein